jgi:two-component system sensor histidine kinase/response regulator
MTTKILVIEDAPALRKDILEMLSYENYDVQGAENGLVGLQVARQYRPDLIICDIMMPELDGFGVLAELQKDITQAIIPFIFLTARTDKSDMRQGMESGANDYLTKPFTATELIGAVETQLEKARLLREYSQQKENDLRDNIILALPHELRTPLTGILGFSDILASDCQFMEADKIAEMANYIHSAANRLYRLTENYLVYAQLEVMLTDEARIAVLRQYTTTDPRAVIEDSVIQKAQEAQRESDLVLKVEASVTVNILEDNLKKIVEELIDNAFKFSQPGTPVEIASEVKNNQFILTITDHGRGIPLHNLSDIGAYSQFERKWHEQQGSGFGLIIAKRLSMLHKGDLDISSQPNHETKITVRLPLQNEAAAEKQPAISAS